MPGRVLVVDPMMPHRVMLKAQLSRDFFSVETVGTAADMAHQLAAAPPDVVLLSWSMARAEDFAPLRQIRANPARAHLPVILLHASEGPERVWQDCNANLGDEVMPYNAPRWLMAARVNQLVRTKEKIDAMRARHRTLGDMGFAEDHVSYPPQGALALTLDLSGAGLDTDDRQALVAALRRDFARVVLRDPDDTSAVATGTLAVISEIALGRDAARRALATRHRRTAQGETSAPQASGGTLYVAANASRGRVRDILDLGADDFLPHPARVAELATRLRRLAWQNALQAAAEKAMSRHLHSALIDPLTGLYNRRYAAGYLSRLLGNAGPQDWITVMMLDLDNFKAVNDRFGHPAGDAVLREVAARLGGSLRSSDLLARVGGEEFLIVISGLPDDRARAIAERLRTEVAAHPFLAAPDLAIPLSVSIGVAQARRADASCDVETMLHRADAALFDAKHAGRNRVTFAAAAA